MNVLSFISWLDVHDTSAALVCDGRVVAAAEEARFTRVNHDGAVPVNAIGYCLREGGLEMGDVDLVAFPERPFRTGRDAKLATIDRTTLWRLFRAGHVRARGLAHHAALTAALKLPIARSAGMDPIVARAFAVAADHYGQLPPVRFYDHHEAHAALALLASGSERAAIATIDGRGDPYSTVTWEGRGLQLRRMRAEPWCNSLGFFYRDCTHYLGLGEFGEGKTMGLAAYGDPQALRARVERLFRTPAGSRWYRYLERPRSDRLGFPARDGQPPTQPPYPDMAATVQLLTEISIERIAGSARSDAGTDELCLGGGVALNCAANGRLRAAGDAPVSVFAAAGDAGLSIGAAMLAARDAGDLAHEPLEHAYLGPGFDGRAIEAALGEHPELAYARSSRLEEDVAERLAAGAVVGWFQGRMEMGPRALGNRSILADPRDVATRDRVNRLKGRERWRPLAPAVLAERAGDFFEQAGESPYMLFADRVLPAARGWIPAVVHVDGSARPQTVRRGANPRLYELLRAFERRAGVPVLLNTSFNSAGEPIVCSPHDAIRSFRAMRLDVLVLGDWICTAR
jgi:carbamoyltransferase